MCCPAYVAVTLQARWNVTSKYPLNPGAVPETAYKTVLKGIKRTIGGVGKENEKELFIKRKINTLT